jgi:hypothetical protein
MLALWRETMQTMKMGILFFFVFFMFPITCFSVESKPFSARVSVSVSADKNIQGQIESYITRELRSLGDVIVTDDNPRWTLSIIALTTANVRGQKTGIAMSIVILEPFCCSEYVANQVPEDVKVSISLLTMGLYGYSDHWLRICSPEDMRSLCTGIVADFDSKHLKKAREALQILNNI